MNEIKQKGKLGYQKYKDIQFRWQKSQIAISFPNSNNIKVPEATFLSISIRNAVLIFVGGTIGTFVF